MPKDVKIHLKGRFFSKAVPPINKKKKGAGKQAKLNEELLKYPLSS